LPSTSAHLYPQAEAATAAVARLVVWQGSAAVSAAVMRVWEANSRSLVAWAVEAD